VLDQTLVENHPDFEGHESVVFSGNGQLNAIIAIHNSNLGRATGGCRMFPYANNNDALTDVLRLSRGMTYKSALAGLPLGGGKAVIIGDPKKDKSRELLLAMGDFINSLEGRYVTAEDSGTGVDDIATMGERTPYVSGVLSGDRYGGDPSPLTAFGVFCGIREAVAYRCGTDLKDVRVAIQGVGNVGYHLARLLSEAGASVLVADVNEMNLKRAAETLSVEVTTIDRIVDAAVRYCCRCGEQSAQFKRDGQRAA
jgi:leucine dehydrogenase